jgi:positive regulator of sigma E activity
MSDHVEIGEIAERLKSYVNTNIELLKLELTERCSVIGASLLSSLLVVLIVALFVFFVSLWLGFYLSDLLGDSYSGFAIIAGFYLILGIVLILGKSKFLESPLRDKIIQKVLNKNEVKRPKN